MKKCQTSRILENWWNDFPSFSSCLCLVVTAGLLIQGGGCGKSSGLDRAIVSGMVTYQGEPIAAGMIRFVPIGDAKGTAETGRILNGSYTVKAKGGVPVGTHRVEIQAFQDAPHDDSGVPGLAGVPDRKIQILPPKFNSASEIERTVESDKKKITIDFTLD